MSFVTHSTQETFTNCISSKYLQSQAKRSLCALNLHTHTHTQPTVFHRHATSLNLQSVTDMQLSNPNDHLISVVCLWEGWLIPSERKREGVPTCCQVKWILWIMWILWVLIFCLSVSVLMFFLSVCLTVSLYVTNVISVCLNLYLCSFCLYTYVLSVCRSVVTFSHTLEFAFK